MSVRLAFLVWRVPHALAKQSSFQFLGQRLLEKLAFDRGRSLVTLHVLVDSPLVMSIVGTTSSKLHVFVQAR